MEVGFIDFYSENRSRLLAELDHPFQELSIGRDGTLAVDPQHFIDSRYEEEQMYKASSVDEVSKAVEPVVAGAVRHQQQVRPLDMDEAGIATSRRCIGTSVRTRRTDYAERGHANEFLGMLVNR
jgi:hypothetical protein